MLLAPIAGYAQIPGTIDYRGYLTTEAGQPLNGTVSVTFSIYDLVLGGAPLWQETQTGITVSAGRFDVVLGTVTPLLDDLDIEGFDRTLYLGLAVNAGAELTPRLPLPGSAFSFASAPTRGRTSVDCSAGQTISGALARAPAGGRYVIEISGICNENVRIDRDRTTLRGIGGASVTGASPSGDNAGRALWIKGARSVEIDALVIEPQAGASDPVDGLLLSDNASFALRNGAVVRNFDDEGVVLVENSAGIIDSSSVTGNGTNGVVVLQGSFLEGRSATVTNNGERGLNLHNSGSVVLSDSTVTGNGNYAATITLGSTLALEGNTLLESSIPRLSDGATVGLYDKGVLRVSGANNRIINTVPVVYANDIFSDGGGAAIDAERNSSVRIDRGTATIQGWVYTFNLATIDIRDAIINGHVYADSLHTHIRLRNQGGSILNGNVRITSLSTFHAKVSPDPEAVIINGLVDCQFERLGPEVDFQDADDGYINCTDRPTDLTVTLEESTDPVTVGNPVTYTARLDTVSSDPFVGAANVNLAITVDGGEYEFGTITPGGVCSDPGTGSFSGQTVVNCFLRGLAGEAAITVDVTPTLAGQLSVSANANMSNPDSNGGNESDDLTTTAQ